jgi:hypothetical protein
MTRGACWIPVCLLAGCLFVSEEDRAGHTDLDGDGVPASVDCDDGYVEVGESSTESCNGVDDDCDGLVDEGLLPDIDGDGFGLEGASGGPCFVGWAARGGDCDDDEARAHPGGEERCDGVDNGCTGTWEPADELGLVTWEGEDGSWQDLTPSFAEGVIGDPVEVALPAAGTLRICRGSGAHAVRLVGEEVVALAIEGLPISLPGDNDAGDALPTLNGADSTEARGAVIEITGEDWDVSVRGLRIVGGQATATRPGGGLHLSGGSLATLRDLEVVANHAGGDGGGGAGLYLNDVDRVVLLDSVVADNRGLESTSGGGILAIDVDLRISGVTFSDNVVQDFGGAVFLQGRRLVVFDSTFSDNFAANGGGALFVAEGSSGWVHDSVFEANEADEGGGAWVEGNLSCFSVLDGVGFLDHVVRYRAGVYMIVGAGRASFAGCTAGGSVVSTSTHPEAEINPDIFAGADLAAEGFYYAITGPHLFCDVLGCEGDISD